MQSIFKTLETIFILLHEVPVFNARLSATNCSSSQALVAKIFITKMDSNSSNQPTMFCTGSIPLEHLLFYILSKYCTYGADTHCNVCTEYVMMNSNDRVGVLTLKPQFERYFSLTQGNIYAYIMQVSSLLFINCIRGQHSALNSFSISLYEVCSTQSKYLQTEMAIEFKCDST